MPARFVYPAVLHSCKYRRLRAPATKFPVPGDLERGDTLLVSALDKGVTALRPTVRDGVWSANAVWKTTAVSMYLSTPVVVANTLFGLSHRASGQFFALDAATGEVLWVGSPREAANTAVVKAGELLLLLNDDAELIVASASRRGFEPVVRYTVGDSATWAQPAISGQRLFIKAGRHCHCGRFDWAKGQRGRRSGPRTDYIQISPRGKRARSETPAVAWSPVQHRHRRHRYVCRNHAIQQQERIKSGDIECEDFEMLVSNDTSLRWQSSSPKNRWQRSQSTHAFLSSSPSTASWT